ncbi:hypothetical protein DVF32_17910 [Salmonella enterica subsp. diarizonae]|nr:hypothetical protein [Salmonella enterica subsp. diarizonae]ESG72588.1 hypothetical protein SEEM1594_07605 [Salmonella enterica subsp. enterica serovar Muenchen str. baa1594]
MWHTLITTAAREASQRVTGTFNREEFHQKHYSNNLIEKLHLLLLSICAKYNHFYFIKYHHVTRR